MPVDRTLPTCDVTRGRLLTVMAFQQYILVDLVLELRGAPFNLRKETNTKVVTSVGREQPEWERRAAN